MLIKLEFTLRCAEEKEKKNAQILIFFNIMELTLGIKRF